MVANSRNILTARWLAPMHAPPIRDGAVVISSGRILIIGPRKQIIQQHPDADVADLGDAVLLPGLVNAHTHLELSNCQSGDPPTDGFASWLVGMLKRTRITPEEMDKAVVASIDIGVRQSLKFGVTTVGDISRQCRITRPLLRSSPLRVVSFGEVQAMAQRRGFLEERLAIAADTQFAGPRLTIGITPHAPYSVEPVGYRRCLQTAREQHMPLATHLAETRDETPFLTNHTGPLRDLWDQWLTWDDAVPTSAGGPIRYARELGLLEYPTLLAHVNYCDDDEMQILAQSKASVVYCPRTHQYFGHAPHRWCEMRANGINVALGTDSCASSPNLNLVDDLRLIHRLYPAEPPAELWQMVTLRAARAVGLKDAGAIRPGDPADLAAFDCQTDEPLREILERDILPRAVWAEGNRVI